MTVVVFAAAFSIFVLASTGLWAGRPRRLSKARSTLDFQVLRPCAGADADLAANLVSCPAALVGVADRADPAHAIAERLLGRNVIVTNAEGPNAKAGQLARLARDVTAPILVVADADVDLTDFDFPRLLGPLEAGFDVAWTAPIEVAAETLGDRASAAILGGSLHSFALLAGLDGRCLVGKLFAIRRDALERIGGFDSLRSYIGEDMELARRLDRVAFVPMHVVARRRGQSMESVLDRYTRWVAVIRTQRPHLLIAYPFFFAPIVPLVLSIAALPRTVVPFVALAFARLGIGLIARLRTGSKVRVVDFLLADFALFVAWMRAITTREIRWGGRTIALARQPREAALGETKERARSTLVDDGAVALATREAIEENGDGLLVIAGDRLSETNAQLGERRAAEGVVDGAGHDDRLLREPSHRLAPSVESERPLGERRLAALREDPDEPARPIQELDGMANRARSVARVLEIDAERADLPEEGQSPQVRRVHEREGIAAEHPMTEHLDHDRIPPRGMIRDDEHRPSVEERAHGLEAGHAEETEGAADAFLGIARQPGREESALRRGDHR